MEIRVLTEHGDETLTWDTSNEDEVKAAAAKFDELKGQGFEFFEVAETRGQKVEAFRADLGKLIAAPGAKGADAAQGRSKMGGGPLASG